MTTPAFPKIFHLGHRAITRIFDGPVEVTEKIDGSQFSFGVIAGELMVRSKGKVMQAGTVMVELSRDRKEWLRMWRK